MICPKCVAAISDDSRYCPQCGQGTALAGEKPTETIFLTYSELKSEAEPPSQALTRTSIHEATPVASSPDPEKLHTQLTKANLCRLRRDWPSAIDHCVNVLQVQPGNQTAHSLLSDIYRDQGKLDDAIQWIRLAIDLKPNAADAAKLQKLEAERTRRMRYGDSRLLGSGASASMALASDGVPTGTTKLMGVTPRRWLNGMTLASMGFLGAVMVVLFLMQVSHKGTAATPRYTAVAPRTYGPNEAMNNLLPAAPAVLPRTSSVASANRSEISHGSVVAPPPHATVRDLKSVNLPSAPVLQVRPANSNPAAASTPAVSPHTGAAPLPPIPSGDVTELPGGMWIASVQFPDTTTAHIRIAMPQVNPAELRPETRELMLRNVFRAANRTFAAQEAVQYVTLELKADNSSIALLTATLDRAAANALDPDTASFDQLEKGLQSLHWAEEAAPQAASNGTPNASP